VAFETCSAFRGIRFPPVYHPAFLPTIGLHIQFTKTVKKLIQTPLDPTAVTVLTVVCPYIVSVIVNDDQQDAAILAYVFIPNQLYRFRAMSSPIIRST
jgi:hypothetical protein